MDTLKEKLYRLHFLLTEKESKETIQKSLDQFKSCFTDAMKELSAYLCSSYTVNPESNHQIVELAFKYKLVNKEMANQLQGMVHDFNKLESAESSEQIYRKIQESHAGYLQMIFDMLSRMGQDAEEE